MVAEVVLSVMGNRSDRRFANLSNSRALEAVEPIRTRRADFHQGPEHSNKAPYRGRIYDCNRLRFTPTNGLALGAGSIYESSNPLRSAPQSALGVSRVALQKKIKRCLTALTIVCMF